MLQLTTESGGRKAAQFSLEEWDRVQMAARILLGLNPYEGPVSFRQAAMPFRWSLPTRQMHEFCYTTIPTEMHFPYRRGLDRNFPCSCGKVIWRVQSYQSFIKEEHERNKATMAVMNANP